MPRERARVTIAVEGMRWGSVTYWMLKVAVPRISGGRTEESGGGRDAALVLPLAGVAIVVAAIEWSREGRRVGGEGLGLQVMAPAVLVGVRG
jgi:hypothetical protein